MKKSIFLIIIVIIAGFILQGCSNKVIPSASNDRKNLIKTVDSTTFDYVFTEALKQKFLGNAGDALKYLEQCLIINPESDAAYYEMAQIALMLEDHNLGKKLALRAATINEKNLWYLLLIADIYYQEKILDSAIIFYEKAIEYFPGKENIKMSLANIYSEARQYKKAEEIYGYFERIYGASEATSLALIKNLMNSGDFKRAEEKIQELLEKSPEKIFYNGLLAEIYRSEGEIEKARTIYRKLLEKNPGNAQTLISLSDFLLNEKQYEDLFQILNEIILNDSITRENKVSLFLRIIGDTNIVRIRPNDIELALIVLEADNKSDDIILLLRPELYRKENKNTDAVIRLEEIIEKRPENYYAWERLLLLYSETRDWDKLFEKGKDCATKFNRSFLAKVLYANAAMEKEKLTIAEEELKKAKILAGNDTDLIVQVLVMEADLYYRKKEFGKSFETFKEALKTKPGDIMILNNYAYYLAEQGEELKEAERMAKLVIEKEKGNTTYLDTYAWVLYKRGRYKESMKIMEWVINKKETPNAEWYEHLGYIMKALKRCDKALEYWKIAYQIDSRKNLLLKEIEDCEKRK